MIELYRQLGFLYDISYDNMGMAIDVHTSIGWRYRFKVSNNLYSTMMDRGLRIQDHL